MKVHYKVPLQARIWQAVKEAKELGKVIDFIEVSAEEHAELNYVSALEFPRLDSPSRVTIEIRRGTE